MADCQFLLRRKQSGLILEECGLSGTICHVDQAAGPGAISNCTRRAFALEQIQLQEDVNNAAATILRSL